MKEVLIVFFIVTVFIMAMAFPFKTRVITHVNLLNTKGYYNLKVMRIKLLTGRFFIDENDGFVVENSADLISSNYNKPFIKSLSKNLLENINVKKVELYYTGGLKNDAYVSAMLGGFISSVIKIIYSYLSEKYDDVKLYEDVETTFYDNNLEFTFSVVVSVSLMKIMTSIFKANKEIKMRGNLDERTE